MPAGLKSMAPVQNDPDAAFFWRTMDEQMIETPGSGVMRTPDGAFYLTDLTQIYTGFEA